jgi:hypothetical protein
MEFCPRCGNPLKASTTSTPPPQQQPYGYRRNEIDEKNEKQEKNEQHSRGEKHEKGAFGFVGWLIGGLILIALGISAYLQAIGMLNSAVSNAVFLVFVGIVIIVIAVVAATTARRRHPIPKTT